VPADDVLVGVAVDTVSSRFKVNTLGTAGRMTTYSVAAYGAAAMDAWTARFDVIYGHHATTYARSIAVTGVSEIARGHFASDSVSGHAEISRKVDIWSDINFAPFVAVDVIGLHSGPVAETSTASGGGAGLFALNIAARDMSVRELGSVWISPRPSLSSTTPLSHRLCVRLGRTILILWPKTMNSFAMAPGYDFEEFSAGAPHDAARLDGHAVIDIDGYQLAFNAGTQLGNGYTGYDIQLDFKVQW